LKIVTGAVKETYKGNEVGLRKENLMLGGVGRAMTVT
jgi:hypothetical protein